MRRTTDIPRAKPTIVEVHNKIQYTSGQLIRNTVFIEEISPHIFPSGNTGRRGRFVCQFCGNSFETLVQKIRDGRTTSCGCFRAVTLKRCSYTHGLSNHPCFYLYIAIRHRCFNTNDPSYPNYGGRGITMCDEWRCDPKTFFDHVEKLPHYGEVGRSIDRYPDNDGNYAPGNIRWATGHEQAVNKRQCLTTYTGVFQRKQRFSSAIKYQRKKIHIGTFNTAEEAAIARDQYIIKNKLWEYPLQILKRNATH